MKRRKQEVPIFENPIAENNIAEFVVNVKATTQDMKCFCKGFVLIGRLSDVEEKAIQLMIEYISKERKTKDTTIDLNYTIYDGNIIKRY